jgi:hypothetical protein
VTKPGGGVPFMLPSGLAYPRAPWWQTEQDPPASLIATANIAAVLHRNGVTHHTWLEQADAWCWKAVDELDETDAYTMMAVIPWLDAVPDRARAEAAFAEVGPKVLDQKIVTLDLDAEGEVHPPLDFAPAPGSLGRTLFDDATIEAGLDDLVAGQRDDGGWTFNWPAWTPAVEAEWRGNVTVAHLQTLRAYGRL